MAYDPVDPVLVAAEVATVLHVAPDDPGVVRAVDAAIFYVGTYTGRYGQEPPLPVPGDPVCFEGLIGFSEQWYLAKYAPTGGIAAVGDGNFEPQFSPRDLFARYHYCFDHLYVELPIA
jgi:hypothetical protein